MKLRRIGPFVLFFLSLAQCQERTVRQNYTGSREDQEIGIMVQKGYRFRISGDLNEPVDRLNLEPGTYLIEYVDTFTRMHGATLCEVKKGERYEVYPAGFRDFPNAMKRVIIGKCYPQTAEKK